MFFRFIILSLLGSGIAFLPVNAQTQGVSEGCGVTGNHARNYVCYRVSQPLLIDGKIDEQAWQEADWSSHFVDITGDAEKEPRFSTRMKMLWDKEYLYIAAELEEPHLSGSITQRDAVIFHDDDFEVFIDPDGDTHNYYELEINALNAVWDLFLTKPYRDGPKVLNGFDFKDLKSAVSLNGTLNQPSDQDGGWTLEIALPLKSFTESGYRINDGTRWRINFSRVEWQYTIEEGMYIKKKDKASGRNLPEDNWVWSPQGAVDMHRPELWGFLQFTDKLAGTGKVEFIPDPDERVKWSLRTLYYAQTRLLQESGKYSADVERLRSKGYQSENLAAQIEVISGFYSARIDSPHTGIIWEISADGLIVPIGKK